MYEHLTNAEIIEMIDEYLEDELICNPKWYRAMLIIRAKLVKEEEAK